MKDQGLVSVRVGAANIIGPVAVLMENEAHFLGAHLGDGNRLILEMFPKTLIRTEISWQRGGIAAQQLLAKVENLNPERFAVPVQVRETPEEAKVGSHMPGAGRGAVPTRSYGSERRTTIVSDGQVIAESEGGYPEYHAPTSYPGYYGGAYKGYGQSVLEDVRNLAGVTKKKLAEVKGKEGIEEKKPDSEKNS